MKSDLRSIKKASFIKRVVAVIMDGAVTIFAFFALYLFVFMPIANAAFGYKNLKNESGDLQIKSHLYVEQSEGSKSYIALIDCGSDDVNFYKEHLHDYYVNFKTTEAPDHEQRHVYEANGAELLPSEYYTEAWFNEKFNNINDIDSIKSASKDALYDLFEYLKPYSVKIRKINYFIYKVLINC